MQFTHALLKSRVRRTSIAALAWLVAVSATAGSPPAAEDPQPVRDAWIDGRLETTYALNPHLSAAQIDTDVSAGVVTLAGTLRSEIDRDLAEQLAKGIDGVREVDNRLVVQEGGAALPAGMSETAGRSFPQWVEDATNTARVKSNLVANRNTRGLVIDVATENDVVTLKGQVASRKELMLAEMIARNTDGIITVRNELEVSEAS